MAARPAPSRRDRRTARTRQAILDAARELMTDQGFSATTVDQIAERADVAPRTFFRHFASKEAVVFAQFDEHRQQMVALIAARPAHEHPLRAAIEGLAAYCAVLAKQRERMTWAVRIVHDQGLFYEQTMMKADACTEVSQVIARRLGADETLDPRPHAWAVMVMTLFGAAMRQALEPGGSGDPVASFRALVGDTAEGFGPPGPAPGSPVTGHA